MNGKAQWQNSREIVKRVVITGTLVLDTPASFSNGDAEGLTDLPLLRDPLDGAPLLTGASLAGALRNYLRELDGGYGATEATRSKNKSRAELLFGHLDESQPQRPAGVQSALVIDDMRGAPPAAGGDVELRDGVSIDPATRTAKTNDQGRGQKYDYELLAAGTTFPLCCELALTDRQSDNLLLAALVDALSGLSPRPANGAVQTGGSGAISLGLRKRRGLGACHVEGWRTCTYDLTTPAGLVAWLRQDDSQAQAGLPATESGPDRRRALHIVAQFDLQDSLLIRAETGEPDAPDMLHLRSWRGGEPAPMLPGTSIAGAIRGRCLRIANTVLGSPRGTQLVDAVFGRAISGHTDEPSGSLLSVAETRVEGRTVDLVQSRVKIDRFTGGAYPAALFSQQPVWSGETGERAKVVLDLLLRQPVDSSASGAGAQKEHDFAAGAGLLLLALKDLWTGDLPLGGESSVGRGRLAGRLAQLAYGDESWTLTSKPEQESVVALVGDRVRLEKWIEAFLGWTKPDERKGANQEVRRE